MITIAELFPFYRTCYKWYSVFREISRCEQVRFEKEYVIHVFTKKSEEYIVNGKLHKTDGPARIGYYKNGNIVWEEWWFDGELHRTDGPASVGYHENGSICWQRWWFDGKRHRTDGPACIDYDRNGKITFQYWFINGHSEKNDHFDGYKSIII